MHMNTQMTIFILRCNVFSTVAVMGFNQTEETQLEEGGHITVCVEIFRPILDEPVAYPFNIRVRTVDGTAGKC